MENKASSRWRIGFLELLLLIAVTLLLIQVFPEVIATVLRAINPTNWLRTTWLAVNLLVVLILLAVRFGPDLYADWRKRQLERLKHRREEEQKNELKQQRKLLEESRAARRRRIY